MRKYRVRKFFGLRKVHHLFYFMTIAEQGSVSKAAEKLLLGQPTLSAQLKEFEENTLNRLSLS